MGWFDDLTGTIGDTVSSIVKSVGTTVKDTVKNPVKGVLEGSAGLVTSQIAGLYSGIAAQKATRNYANGQAIIPSIIGGTGATIEETGIGSLLMGKQPLPNIAVQDPQATAAKNASERAAAARAAQVQYAQDTPGRGGTILTDRYTYNT